MRKLKSVSDAVPEKVAVLTPLLENDLSQEGREIQKHRKGGWIRFELSRAVPLATSSYSGCITEKSPSPGIE